MPLNSNYRTINRWLIFVTLAATVFAVTFNSNDSTFLKPYFLVIGSAAVFSFWLYCLLSRPTIECSIHSFHFALALYWIVCALSLFKAINVHLGLENLLQVGCFLMMALMTTTIVDQPSERSRLNTVFIIITILTCVAGLIQNIKGVLPFADYMTKQTTSTFGNTNYFAGFLVMMLPLTFSQMTTEKRFSLKQIFLSAVCIFVVVFLIKTEARSAWIGASISLLILLVFNGKIQYTHWISIGVIITSIVIIAFFFPEIISRRVGSLFELNTTSSFARRLFFYEGAWKAFLASPLLGNGIGNFILFLPRYRSPEYWMAKAEDIVPHAHNEYLEILSETGILGFIAFVIIIFLLGKGIIQNIKTGDATHRTLLLGYGAAIAGSLIDNLSSMNLRVVPVALSFWIIAGVVFSYPSSKRIGFEYSLPVEAHKLRFCIPILFCAFLFLYTPKMLTQYRAEKHLLEGSLLRWQNDLPGSSEQFQYVLNDAPSQTEARLYLAANLIQSSDFRNAKKHIDTLLAFSPHYPKARIISAIAQFELKDTASSMIDIIHELALENSPQSLFYATDLAIRGKQANDAYQYAYQLLAQSIKADSRDYVSACLQQMRILQKKGITRSNYDDILTRIQDKFSTDTEILTEVAISFMQYGRKEHANKIIVHLKKVATNDPNLIKRLKEIESMFLFRDSSAQNSR